MAEFEHIANLVRIIFRNGTKETQNFFRLRSKQSQEKKLAQAFLNYGSSDTENAVAQRALDLGSQSREYERLRSKLKARLHGLLFHLQFPGGSELRKAMYRNNKRVFQIKTLTFLGARRQASRLLQPALREARRFELTHNEIEILTVLCSSNAQDGKRHAYQRSNKELEYAFRVAAAEREVRYYEEQIHLASVLTGSESPVLAKRARAYAIASLHVFTLFPTYNIGLLCYHITALDAQLQHDFRRAIAICVQAEEFFKRFEHLSNPSRSGEFATKRLACSVSLNDLEAGIKAANDCQHYFPAGSANWFVYKEYEFLLFMHNLQFDRAFQLLYEVQSEARFTIQPDHRQEKWKLLSLYVRFAQSERVNLRIPEFRKFIRFIPTYSRDKAGYNIALLILHTLILLEGGHYSEIISRTEAMAAYVKRHLRGKASSQTNSFLRALIQLEASSFNLEQMRTNAHRDLERFLMPHPTDVVEGLEVLPYSYLWKRVETALTKTPG